MSRKSVPWLMVVAVGLFFVFFGSSLRAADFPTKPVTLICAYAPGGTADIVIRTLAETTGKYLGQPVVVENKGGGGGTLGPATMAATAKPDGYTLAQMPVTLFRNPHMMKVTWDPFKDFTYIIHVTGYTFGVVVKADAPWKTMDDLVQYAKANPGKVTYNSPGTGSTLHIVMETIAMNKGIKWIHVPTKGGGEETPMVLGGHVTASANSSGGWASQVEAGNLRLLAPWGDKRMKRFPNVPTLKESGYGIVSTSSFGIGAPKGLDPKVVKILHDAFKKGMDDPVFLKVLDKLDMPYLYLNTEEYNKYNRQVYEEEDVMIEKLGLSKKK